MLLWLCYPVVKLLHELGHAFAAKLEAYPVGETVPWSRYFAARGRALAAFGAGHRNKTTVAQLRALHAEACECGCMAAVPRLAEAINLYDNK